MPSGSKIRVRIASSYAAPSSLSGNNAWPATYPAAAAIRLLYWKSSPNFVVGCMPPSVRIAEAGVAPLNSNSHSKSCRGRPVHAQSRCFTSTCWVVLASPSLNAG